MATTFAPISIDREELVSSFRRWEADQAALDAQFAESVQALAAYQSHLDGWQRQLAVEREELQQLRAAIEHDRALSVGGEGPTDEQLQQVNQELIDARQKVTSLTAVLLTRTEELRDLDRLRGDANNELAVSRSREKELAAALAAQQQKFAAERQQLEGQLKKVKQQQEQAASKPSPKSNDEPPPSGRSKPDSAKTTSPVLGSVMEQFGKLRQQRSLGRTNNSTPR